MKKPNRKWKYKIFANFNDGRGHVPAFKTLYNTREEAEAAASRIASRGGHNPLFIKV